MFPIVLREHGEADDRFAAHFQRAAIADREREAPDGEHLRRDVLPLRAVAARRGAHERAVFVRQAHGQPVELVFHRKFGGGIDFPHPRDERGKLVLGDGFIETVQPRDMRVPRERLDRLAPHAAGRRIGQAHARLPLQRLQFVVQLIVFPVGYAGIIEHVVLIRPLI